MEGGAGAVGGVFPRKPPSFRKNPVILTKVRIQSQAAYRQLLGILTFVRMTEGG